MAIVVAMISVVVISVMVVVSIMVMMVMMMAASLQSRWICRHSTLSDLIMADGSRHRQVPSTLAECRVGHAGMLWTF